MQITSALLLISQKNAEGISFGWADWNLTRLPKNTPPSLICFKACLLWLCNQDWIPHCLLTAHLILLDNMNIGNTLTGYFYCLDCCLCFTQNHTKNTVHRLLSPWKQQRPGCLWEPHVQHQRQGRRGQSCSIRSQSKYCLHHGLKIDYPHLNLMTQISNGTTLCARLWKRKPYASTQTST